MLFFYSCILVPSSKPPSSPSLLPGYILPLNLLVSSLAFYYPSLRLLPFFSFLPFPSSLLLSPPLPAPPVSSLALPRRCLGCAPRVGRSHPDNIRRHDNAGGTHTPAKLTPARRQAACVGVTMLHRHEHLHLGGKRREGEGKGGKGRGKEGCNNVTDA